MSQPSAGVPDLVPARILNEHVYCPRLAYLEWVDRQFEDSADTVDGRWVHRRVDDERDEANLAEDSIAIFDLGQPTGRGIDCIEFLGRRRSLEDPGAAAIW